jgi:hypothetical protein
MKQLLRFTLTGYVYVDMPEDYDFDARLVIEDRYKQSLQQMEVSSDQSFDFCGCNDVSVNIETPKSDEIKKIELESIEKLAECFKAMGYTPTIGTFDRYSEGESPAILDLNGARSPRHGFVASTRYDFYNLTYQLCVTPYHYKYGGQSRTFLCKSGKDFKYEKLAKIIADNLVYMGLLK